MSKEKNSNIHLVQLSNYVKPEIKEVYGHKYVLNGKDNSFFQYVLDRMYGSPTNNAIINVYSKLYYGRGIVQKGQTDLYDELNEVMSKDAQRNTLADCKMFGMFAVKLVRNVGGRVGKIKHFPVNKLGMEKADDKGVINNVYYSYDWSNKHKYKPIKLPVFMGKMTEKEMILVYKPYQAGNFYYSYPNYMAGLQYAEIEEEISNFSINHIKNGLSFGYVINFNNGGNINEEMRDEIERRIKDKLTGSSNAGQFVLSFNDGKEAEVTVHALDVNDAHNQWESLRDDAKYQILTTHGVTSPLLFGMSSATGFGSNADELDTASKLLQDYQISPTQEQFLDALKPAFELAGLETDLEFLPLRETYGKEKEEETVEDNVVDDLEEEVELSEQYDTENIDLEALFAKGEDIDNNEWELLDDRKCGEITLKEDMLNMVFQFASTPSGDSRKQSDQDTSLFKIRYRYAGNPFPQREFCKKIMAKNKVYRAEDLENAGAVNPGFGKGGADTYNIFLYKGGVNCRHWWQRVIYLKKGNKKISVNKAKKMILDLEPEDRKNAKWEANDPKVAQSASASNNYWRAN